MLKRHALLVPLAASLLLGGCTLDPKKIESSIMDEVKKKKLPVESVTCPAGRKLKEGDEFDCKGKLKGGDEVDFHVKQVDGAGNIKWKLDGMIIDQEKIGDSIEEKVGKSADVKCPGKVVILKVDESFTCKVKVGDEEHKVKITLVDEEGNVKWEIKS